MHGRSDIFFGAKQKKKIQRIQWMKNSVWTKSCWLSLVKKSANQHSAEIQIKKLCKDITIKTDEKSKSRCA